MAKSAKLMPSLRRTHQSLSNHNPFLFTSKLHPVSQITTTRSWVSEMREAAFEDNIRREIRYELQHSPSNQATFLYDFKIVHTASSNLFQPCNHTVGECVDTHVIFREVCLPNSLQVKAPYLS
ncbi:hypothetical protein Ddye_027825 [Dipteronia dyeriana]|uniref:Uncharacterized protein n=1 Tax=Dipteronia dyeriana TaxID=168575 RepID=A0AAD9TQS4_9ROSI|nr:hypothetical protein Ddye_027825 [Dipteronia dyeriana]